MAKINLTDVVNGTNAAAAINANSDVIELASDTFLSRTGEAPNAMEADIDMNSNRILNLLPAAGATEPVTLGQLEALGIDTNGNGGTGVTDGNKGDITVSNNGTSWLLNTHDIAASNVTSGTMSTARLGSGTADGTTYLRGDSTWAPVAGPGGALPPDNSYGDITVSGTGTVWTIPAETVTHAKYQSLAANTVLGAAGAGAPTELSCTATGRAIIAGNSVAAVRGTLGLGDLSILNEVSTAEIASQAVTHDKYQAIAANSVLGTDGTIGVPQAISCTSTGRQIIASASATAARAVLGVPATSHAHGESEITSVSAAAINAGSGGLITPAKLGTAPIANTFLRSDGQWMSSIAGNALLTSASSLNASNILSGVVPSPARLGTGTPNGTNFLRGDGVWAEPTAVADNGFAACLATTYSGFVDTTGTSAIGFYVPFPVGGTGTLGNISKVATGIQVTPGVTCWYEVSVSITLYRTGGTGSSGFVISTASDPTDLAYITLYPITTADPAAGTTYHSSILTTATSGTTFKLLFARNGSTNTYDYAAAMFVKRVSSGV